jgi:hemolysin III
MNTQSTTRTLPFQTIGEEIVNAILHGLGALAAIVGLVLLIIRSSGTFSNTGDIWLSIAPLIFAVTLILMFLASTLYHAVQHRGAKQILRILDHAAIYLLIAGTYTPLCLITLHGPLGWTLFGIEWFCAVVGITLYAINCGFLKRFELAIYLIMGWAIVFGGVRLLQAINRKSLIFLVVGGIAYTLGTLWYAKGPRYRKTHNVWHVFVLVGATCHWFSVWFL